MIRSKDDMFDDATRESILNFERDKYLRQHHGNGHNPHGAYFEYDPNGDHSRNTVQAD